MDFPPRSLPNLAPADLTQPGISHTAHYYLPTQQAYRPYGVDGAFVFTPQAQLPGGQVATLHDYAPHPFSLSTVHPSHAQHDAERVRNGQSESVSAAPVGPASAMDPPARPRKRKAPTRRADDWKPYKDRILDLHTTLPLEKVRHLIEEEYGFKAELRQYQRRISEWGKDKNIKPHEMRAIVRKRQRRKLVETNKGELLFEVRGNQVEPQKIARWMKRNGAVESALYAPSPAASTPSAVGCHTISERGSPVMMSVYSPAALVSSPGDVYIAAQSLQMLSPALSSVSSIVRLQDSVFTGQSPALACRSLVRPQFSSNVAQSTIEMDVSARSRYKGDEEERLRAQISQAETSFLSSAEETSNMLYRLGGVLLSQGRYKAAEDVARRLVESHKSQSGDSDNSTGMIEALFLLGQVLDYQGLHIKAEKLHRRVLTAREKVLGPEHLDTLMSMSNLAAVLNSQGKYEEAEAMNRQTLARREKVLGPEHPYTLMSMNNLAAVLNRQGKYEEAEAMNRQTLARRERVLGPEHPDALMSMSNLALVLNSQGKYEEAEAMNRQTLARRERVLGPKHPDTLLSVYNLAYLLANRRHYERFRVLYERACAAYPTVLGPNHPTTRACRQH
ncbi:Tetratricopeptide repeat-domain-containing protein [Phaeosphaeriaceae sp. PMI808]|nr:Tetratricopeptide repeat-domain-containing protein [Phaeosphaeriaceae sp. PMI808]